MIVSDVLTLVMVCSVAGGFCAVSAWWLYTRSEWFRLSVFDPGDYPAWQRLIEIVDAGKENWASAAFFVGALFAAAIGVFFFAVVVGCLLLLAEYVREWLVGKVPSGPFLVLVAVLASAMIVVLVSRVVRDMRS